MRDLSSLESANIPRAPAPRAPFAAVRAERPRRTCISKLVLTAPRDRGVIEAVGGYPARVQSCVLAAWLRGGWYLSHARPAQVPDVPPPIAGSGRPVVRLTRRVHFDDPDDPALAGFLLSLSRKERGREIRHFITLALRGSPRRAL